MKRKSSHFQNKESLLEPLLRKLRYQKIIKHIPKKALVLDAGCGYTSYLLQTIEKNISKGIGIDISVTNLNSKKIELIKADLNKKLPLYSDFFDVVVSMANLEHLSKPKVALREFHRVLKPKGKLIITTPSIYNKPILEFLAFKLHLLSIDEIADHKQYYDHISLKKDLLAAGFEEPKIIIKYFQFGLNLYSHSIK